MTPWCAICGEPASIRYGRRPLPLARDGSGKQALDLCTACDTTLRACLDWLIPRIAAQGGHITRLSGGWQHATRTDFTARTEKTI